MPTDETAPVPPVKKKRRIFWRLIKYLVLAFLIVLPVRLFVAEPFVVSGISMEPTFSDNDYIVIDKLTYDFEKPQRGDVIIFRYPLDPSLFFIKRIVGMPGETIKSYDGVLTLI